jgi:hypothetical protein
MPLPDRPVSHAAIESVWGQAIHDYTFAPAGGAFHSVTTNTVGGTPGKLHLDLAYDDPGGYLDAANDQLEVPTGGEGLYVIFISINAVNGDAGTQTRGILRVNGTQVTSGIEDNDDGTNVTIPVMWLGELTAGDILTVYGQRRGSGTNPTTHITTLQMARIGAEFGTP